MNMEKSIGSSDIFNFTKKYIINTVSLQLVELDSFGFLQCKKNENTQFLIRYNDARGTNPYSNFTSTFEISTQQKVRWFL